jgi:hypothetical protein
LSGFASEFPESEAKRSRAEAEPMTAIDPSEKNAIARRERKRICLVI